mmetsp:Transcript_34778/g.53401  ORF Transcript_34778/g.53401 Transcript_34778/m.53401 type:complete len:103 (+) Transcript_34778:1170-1478(+)
MSTILLDSNSSINPSANTTFYFDATHRQDKMTSEPESGKTAAFAANPNFGFGIDAPSVINRSFVNVSKRSSSSQLEVGYHETMMKERNSVFKKTDRSGVSFR